MSTTISKHIQREQVIKKSAPIVYQHPQTHSTLNLKKPYKDLKAIYVGSSCNQKPKYTSFHCIWRRQSAYKSCPDIFEKLTIAKSNELKFTPLSNEQSRTQRLKQACQKVSEQQIKLPATKRSISLSKKNNTPLSNNLLQSKILQKETRSQEYIIKGQKHFKDKEYFKALKSYIKAANIFEAEAVANLEMQQTNQSLYHHLIDCNLCIAYCYLKLNQEYDAVERIIDQILLLEPNNIEALFLRCLSIVKGNNRKRLLSKADQTFMKLSLLVYSDFKLDLMHVPILHPSLLKSQKRLPTFIMNLDSDSQSASDQEIIEKLKKITDLKSKKNNAAFNNQSNSQMSCLTQPSSFLLREAANIESEILLNEVEEKEVQESKCDLGEAPSDDEEGMAPQLTLRETIIKMLKKYIVSVNPKIIIIALAVILVLALKFFARQLMMRRRSLLTEMIRSQII